MPSGSRARAHETALELLAALERRDRVALAFTSPSEAELVTGFLHTRAARTTRAIRSVMRLLDDGRVVLLVLTRAAEQAWLEDLLEEWPMEAS